MGGAVISTVEDEAAPLDLDLGTAERVLAGRWDDEVKEKLHAVMKHKKIDENDNATVAMNPEEVSKLFSWLKAEKGVDDDEIEAFRLKYLENRAIASELSEREKNTSKEDEVRQSSSSLTGNAGNEPSVEENEEVLLSKQEEAQQNLKCSKVRANSKGNESNKASSRSRKVIDKESLPSTAMRCVSLSYILRFTDHFNLWGEKTRDVVSNVILPLSKEKKCAWSELDCSISMLDEDDLGPPQIFVSHAWSNCWGLLVLSLKSHAETYNVSPKKMLCWIDIFVINQHNYMQELKQLDKVIQVCGNFIQVIDSDEAVPLGRVWCLYEVIIRLKYKKSGLAVSVASLTSKEKEDAKKKTDDDVSGIDKKAARPVLVMAPKKRIEELIHLVNMERAQATHPQDVEMIFKEVRRIFPGGFDTVNSAVQDALMRYSVMNTFESASKQTNKSGLSKPNKKQGKKTKGGTHNIAALYANIE